MKIARLISFLLVIAVAPLCHAITKQVTTLTNAAVATILTPGPGVKLITIQNNGSGNVRLSFDGGASYTNPQTKQVGSNPTTSTGYRLAAGASLIITVQPNPNGIRNPIVGILETSTTTTLDISTDESSSS